MWRSACPEFISGSYIPFLFKGCKYLNAFEK